jgi:hypothetical protein
MGLRFVMTTQNSEVTGNFTRINICSIYLIFFIMKLVIFCRYLIPFRGDGDGPCYGGILQAYFSKVNESLSKRDSDCLFYTGQRKTGSKAGMFTKCPIGKNTLSETGKVIATWLGLEHPERYTGHCFRYYKP